MIIQYVIIVIDYCVFKLGQKETLINIIDVPKMYSLGCAAVNTRICIFTSTDIFTAIIPGLALVVDVAIVNTHICKFNTYISIDGLTL